MMDEFEAAVEEQYDAMDEKDQAANFLKFSRIEGDVRCCAHIYNIAIQAGILFFHPFISIVTNFLQLSSQSNLRPKAHVNTTPMHKAKQLLRQMVNALHSLLLGRLLKFSNYERNLEKNYKRHARFSLLFGLN